MNYISESGAVGRGTESRKIASSRPALRSQRRTLELAGGIVALAATIKHPGIARCMRFLRENYRKPIVVTDLAVVTGLSRRGFLKSFRKHTGHTPGVVLRLLRITHAKRLLARGDATVTEVAIASGYPKVNSFGVAFRTVTGLAPREYRRRERTAIHGRSRSNEL